MKAVVAEGADLVLVVGSRNSSNSNRLVEVARAGGADSHLLDDAEQLDPAWLEGKTRVALTAGASAPEVLVPGRWPTPSRRRATPAAARSTRAPRASCSPSRASFGPAGGAARAGAPRGRAARATLIERSALGREIVVGRRHRRVRLPPARARGDRGVADRPAIRRPPGGAGRRCGWRRTAARARCSGSTLGWRGDPHRRAAGAQRLGPLQRSSSPTAAALALRDRRRLWRASGSTPTSQPSARTRRPSAGRRSAAPSGGAPPRSRRGSWTSQSSPAWATCSRTRSSGRRALPAPPGRIALRRGARRAAPDRPGRDPPRHRPRRRAHRAT